MRLTKFIVATVFGLSAFQAGAKEPQSYPPLLLKCATTSSGTGTPFNPGEVRIEIPVPFHVTNKEKRLKFYNARVLFGEDGIGLPVTQPRIDESDVDHATGRFGDLNARQKNDDIPTALTLAGVEYELWSPSSFRVLRYNDDGSHSIDIAGEIEVRADAMTGAPVGESPAWTAVCRIMGKKNQ